MSASITRTLAHASRRSAGAPILLRASARRAYSQAPPPPKSTPPPPPKKSSAGLYAGITAAALGGVAYYLYSTDQFGTAGAPAKPFVPTKEDYQKVYDAVADLLEDNDYDDGSFGPVLLRLGWHASGTYDVETKTGGSNGATMRFAPESDHGANAGLRTARDRLEPVKQAFPWITYSDLWILAAIAAIQEMGGPKIPFRGGRADRDVAACTPDGRLPDATKTQDHLRAIFGRMGFNDQEIVALSGAHALGRCHKDRSGFDGPWTFSPTMLTNDFYKLLVGEKWNWKKWNGPKQYEDAGTKTLMMLPSDMALVKDKSFKKYVDIYAKDNDAFFKDFAAVITKLFELGVPFKEDAEKIWFKASTD